MLWRVPPYSPPPFSNPPPRKFFCYRRPFFGAGGTPPSTGGGGGAYGGRCGRYEAQVFELEVAYEDRLAHAQRRNVYDDLVGEVLHGGAHGELAGREDELAADLHTLGVTGQAYGDGDRYGLAGGDAVEIQVEDLLAYGVELGLTQYGLLLLAVEVELYDVRVGGVDQRFDLAGVYREGDRLAVAAQYAGYQTLATYGLGCLLAEVGALHSLYRNGFHGVVMFLKCYLRRFSTPAPRWIFFGISAGGPPNSACFGGKDSQSLPN